MSMALEELLQRRALPVHVIGTASAEGVAVARLLARLGFERIVLHDSRPRAELRKAFRTTHGAWSRVEQDAIWEELRPLLDRGRFGDDYLVGIADDGADATLVLGQGWYLDPDNRRRIEALRARGPLVTSMSELYFTLAPGPVAGITGTNGKSTTVALADHLLDVAGVPHRTAGNERSNRQFLPEITELPDGLLSLLEVSNRQLLQLDRSPQVAAITALTPDHLEEHGGFAGYVAAKQRIFRFQRAGDVAIANADSDTCLEALSASPGTHVLCGIGARTGPSVCWIDDQLIARDMPVHDGTVLGGERVLAQAADLRMPGDHNRRNAAVAAAVALACGADPSRIAEGLRSFEGKALRLQLLGQVAGVDVYSDIKSTTPEATVAALQALAGRPLVLIAGGDDKGLDYGPLAQAIREHGARALLVPGSATDKLIARLEQAEAAGTQAAAWQRVDTLDQALDRAFGLASPGAVVIVSPAAAGFWTTQLQGGPSLRSRVARRRREPQEVTPT